MNPSARVAVLCVHGIQGSPDQFDWIIRALPGHVDAVSLLLPGHGGDVRSFRRSGMEKWQVCVDDEIQRLGEHYDSILYIGHSMGCLLGIDACLRGKNKVRSLVLLACPLALWPSLRYVRNNLCAALGLRMDDPFVAAAHSGNSVRARNPMAYLSCAWPYLQLLQKMRSVRGRLGALDKPVLAVHSEGDEIVSARSLRYFNGMPKARCRIVAGCGHYLYANAAREEIIGGILEVLDAL